VVTDDVERFRRDYHPLLLSQLSRQDESGLGAAYDLGRAAMLRGVGLLDVVRVHQDLVADVLGSTRDLAEARHVAAAAGQLLVDLLASYDMSHRGFMDIGTSRVDDTQGQDPSPRRVQRHPPSRG
jgi:hypothetical protein